MYVYNFCLEWPILWPPRILTFPSRTPCIIHNITFQKTVNLIFNREKPQFQIPNMLRRSRCIPRYFFADQINL
jgi:hypothetical protein